MRVFSTLVIALLIVLVAQSVTAKRTMLSSPMGCIFTTTLKKWAPFSYNGSSVMTNTNQEQTNTPALVYYGPDGCCSFGIPAETSGAGYIGKLPAGMQLDSLNNYDAAIKATGFQVYQNDLTVGATYYGVGSRELGSVQFAFQVKAFNPATAEVTIDFGAFLVDTVVDDGSNCVFLQRKSTLTRACNNKFAPVSIDCGY
jgi:hypothetical protein